MRRKVRTKPMFHFTAGDCVKYIMFFIAFYLLANAKIEEGIAPFNIGFFLALVFCRENILTLSPIYVLALIAVNPTLKTLLIALMPPLVLGSATLIHKTIKKPMKLLNINIYGFISQLPIVALTAVDLNSLVYAIITLLLAQVFNYCCVIFCHAFFVKGLKYKFSPDEGASFFIFIIALSLGLFKINIFGFKPFFIVIGLVLIATSYLFEPKFCYVIAFVIGLGAGLGEASLAIAGGIFFCALVANIFSKNNIYFAGASIVLTDILIGLYFNAYSGQYHYFQLIGISVGVGLFLAIPKKYRNKLLDAVGNMKSEFAVRTVVNRNREEINFKLKECGKVFEEMQNVLGGGEGDCLLNSKKGIAQEIVLMVCADCANKKECFNSLGKDTSVVFEKLVEVAMDKGKVSSLDIPTFLSSRCQKINNILDVVNSMTELYLKKVESDREVSLSREIMSYQMNGVATMLYTLADNINKEVSFDSERERRILEELSYHNIIASDAIVSCDSAGEYDINIVVRKKDCTKKALMGVVKKILKVPLMSLDIKANRVQGFVNVHMISKPKYNVVYGEASIKKDKSESSGDTYSVMRLGDDKVMLALCDGMGSGEGANKNSTSTMNMIENFYKAGFGNQVVLNLINRLLVVKDSEEFSAIDMSIIDLRNGIADVVKLGGVESLLVRDNSVEVLNTNSLPLGILENVKPHIERKALTHGDMLVLISDGVLEGMSIESITQFIKTNKTLNPQVLADNLLLKATNGKKNAKDDTTVLVARIYSNVG